jgi:hypothetical protein
MLELRSHEPDAAHRPSQRHLVDDRPQPQAAGIEPPLPFLAQVDQAISLGRRECPELNDGERIILCLQQAGDELGVEAANRFR